MFWWFHPRIRHPLYPAVRATPAVSSHGRTMAVSGTFHQLTHAGLRRVEVRRAVSVLQQESDPPLTEAQRDELWHLFRVPVYVLLLDANQRVCAYECEAHQGLHLPPDDRCRKIPPGVETSPCGCGRPGPRLRYRSAPHTGLAVAG